MPTRVLARAALNSVQAFISADEAGAEDVLELSDEAGTDAVALVLAVADGVVMPAAAAGLLVLADFELLEQPARATLLTTTLVMVNATRTRMSSPDVSAQPI